MTMLPKLKIKCSVCKTPFVPVRALQNVCTWECGLVKVEQKREKAARRAEKAVAALARKEGRRAREKLKTRREWLAEAQTAFNRWVRLRDAPKPCISCGRHHAGQYHAGHYLSVGACPELRFDEANVHKQCAPCNNHKSGNLVRYRVRLIKKVGQAEVDRLEGPHEAAKFSIEQLREIKATYARKARELG